MVRIKKKSSLKGENLRNVHSFEEAKKPKYDLVESIEEHFWNSYP